MQRRVAPFQVITDMVPAGDQPTAIAEIEKRVQAGDTNTVLLGATGTGAAGGAARSLSTASLSFANLAAGSACAFSSLSRRSLVLLNWTMPILEVCSTLTFSDRMSLSIRATEASSAMA